MKRRYLTIATIALGLFIVHPWSASATTLQDGLAAYENGNYQAALQDWLPAAHHGNAIAQAAVGMIYWKRYLSDPSKVNDGRKAAYWIGLAAHQGYPSAEGSLGLFHEIGVGASKSDSKASYWFHKGAEHGDSIAAFHLGIFYFKGIGVRQDYAKAAHWFRVSAGRAYPPAELMLASVYFRGNGVPTNLVKAVVWCRRAARQGYPRAEAFLGMMYIAGDGVKKNLVYADKWLILAERGDAHDPVIKSAWYMQSRISADMTPEQRAEANARARIFKPVFRWKQILTMPSLYKSKKVK